MNLRKAGVAIVAAVVLEMGLCAAAKADDAPSRLVPGGWLTARPIPKPEPEPPVMAEPAPVAPELPKPAPTVHHRPPARPPVNRAHPPDATAPTGGGVRF